MRRVIAKVKRQGSVYDRIVKLCAERGTTISAACTAAGVSKSTAVHWKRGGGATDASLEKIARLFGVSRQALRGEDG